MRTHRAVVMLAGLLTLSSAFAQQPNIEQYVSMFESGQQEAVREKLPELLRQYPNDPGVLYLQALLTTDGAEAVRQYQKIVDTYPNSVWADDALYKVYKFYYAIGLYRTAELKLNQLRTNYPNSRYISGKTSPETAGEKITETASKDTALELPQQEAVPPKPATDVTAPPTSLEQRPAPVTPAPTVGKVEPAKVAGPFTLQVGAYSTAANANRQKAFFDYHNYPADVTRKVSGSKELFVVYVGSFATEEDARRTGEELKRSYRIDYLIVKR